MLPAPHPKPFFTWRHSALLLALLLLNAQLTFSIPLYPVLAGLLGLGAGLALLGSLWPQFRLYRRPAARLPCPSFTPRNGPPGAARPG
jgi:hypothetical protein